jgi:small subunit ribosomal protein S20
MANTIQAKKRVRQNARHYQHNTALRSMYRTYIKNVVNAIQAKNKEEAKKVFAAAIPVIDRMVSKGIVHKNKAARHKSRLTSHIKAMQ